MQIINKIEALKKQRKVSNTDLAEKTDMSRGGFELMLKSGDMKISTLKAIADFFNVPITYFFEDNKEVESSSERSIDEVFDAMKELVKSKILK